MSTRGAARPAGPTPRQDRRPASTAELIVRAAETVFPSLGYDRTTMADLAGAAGVTRPTVYAYFGSKAEVFRAVAESVRDDILAVQDAATGASPADTARLGVVGYLDAYVRHLGVLTVLSHQALTDPEMSRLRDEIHDRANRRHTTFIQRLAAAGDADPVVPAAVLSEAVTGIVMRLAEEITAFPSRRNALAGHLSTMHQALLRMSGG